MKFKVNKITVVLLSLLVMVALAALIQHYDIIRHDTVLSEGRELVTIEVFTDSGIHVKTIGSVKIEALDRNLFDSSLGITYTDYNEKGDRELHYIKIPKHFVLNSWTVESRAGK